jgi:hypothetical protein
VIIYANDAFKKMLFGSHASDLELQNIKLGDMCADEESREEYAHVEQLRKVGETVKPYFLNLKYKEMPLIRVQVIGAALPSEIRNSLPGTFGILIAQIS